jgi:hypothetical protein
MVENELVKVNPEASELDCVFEVEEAVDSVPVPVLDVSVVCCALAASEARNCNHINWPRMVDEVTGPRKVVKCILAVANPVGSQESPLS